VRDGRRTYLDEDADLIRSLVAPDVTVPEESCGLFIFYAVLMRAKGTDVSAADVHDAWAAWKQTTAPDSPHLVPFDELAAEVQAEDEPYADAIRAAAKVRAGGD
jgi:hypothetical protein